MTPKKQIDDLHEALARLEAERDEALKFMRINARSGMSYAEERDQYRDLYDASIGFADRYKVERDAAQEQLAEAISMMKRVVHQDATEERLLSSLTSDIRGFLARHAQAEQLEAGDVLPRVENPLPMPKVKPPKQEAQPAEWVEPVGLTSAGPVYDQGFADGVAEAKRLNAVRGAEHE